MPFRPNFWSRVSGRREGEGGIEVEVGVVVVWGGEEEEALMRVGFGRESDERRDEAIEGMKCILLCFHTFSLAQCDYSSLGRDPFLLSFWFFAQLIFCLNFWIFGFTREFYFIFFHFFMQLRVFDKNIKNIIIIIVDFYKKLKNNLTYMVRCFLIFLTFSIEKFSLKLRKDIFSQKIIKDKNIYS